MRLAVIRFPGSNCDGDVARVLREQLGQDVRFVRHDERDLSGFAGVVLPGGFSYGDYLRPGALAAHAPVMAAVRSFAAAGGPVLGICNGFQILCEAGLLPGCLRANQSLRFQCRPVWVRVEAPSALTGEALVGRLLRMEIAHADGAYTVDRDQLQQLEARGQVVLRYVDRAGQPTPAANPNGSVASIAGVCNEAGNVVGLMPHPERVAAGWGLNGGAGADDGGPASRDGLELLRCWVAAAAAWWAAGGPKDVPVMAMSGWEGREIHGTAG